MFAPDWNNVLETQEDLLFGVMDVAHSAGAGMAFPSQTLYLAEDTADKLPPSLRGHSEPNSTDALH